MQLRKYQSLTLLDGYQDVIIRAMGTVSFGQVAARSVVRISMRTARQLSEVNVGLLSDARVSINGRGWCGGDAERKV